jgi:hypothetical protein
MVSSIHRMRMHSLWPDPTMLTPVKLPGSGADRPAPNPFSLTRCEEPSSAVVLRRLALDVGNEAPRKTR